jgi:N-acetylneuraminate synthase
VIEAFDRLFIFEMANNHQGSVRHGLRIVEAMGRVAREHGINAAVKLQYRRLDTFIHPDARDRPDVPHVARFLETRLADDEFLILVEAIRDEGLSTICTPFDESSVDMLVDHGIQIVKVASCSAGDWPLLERVAAANKPVICSTGGRSIYEIDNLVSFLVHRDVEFALMHCVGLYPTPADEVQLDFMSRLMRRYPYVPVGYSGHECPDDTDVVKVAVAKGATILERHVGIATGSVALNGYSMTPEQTSRWVGAALQAGRIGGGLRNGMEKRIRQAEIDSLRSLARGTYARRAIESGAPIGPGDVFFAMPCVEGQTTSGEYQDSMIASQDYAALEPIVERRAPSLVNQIRGIVHDAKGMLYEAQIDFGREFRIELSHHYGMEHFRHVGAIIVTVVNREYCKKLIVVLPGQKHPPHVHKVKEEMFHLLWGDLLIDLDGTVRTLRRGDTVLVERGMKHAFTSKGGAIFEELSTTHVIGDSYYDDERILRLDPMQRKTVLESW